MRSLIPGIRIGRGMFITRHGYVRVRVGIGHPLACSRGYAYAHLVVWAAAGRPLPKRGEELHHFNDNKQDNRLSNLRLRKKAAHSSEHARRKPRYRDGRFRRVA